MTVQQSLGAALRDLYGSSWRLVPLNVLIGIVLLAVAAGAVYVRATLLLVVLAGPLAAALAHCAVTLVQTEDLRVHEAVAGLKRFWRRGLVLAAAGGVIALLGVVAVRFYAGRGGAALLLAFVAVYLLFLAGVFFLLLWPLAVAEPQLPLREAARRTAQLVARRPGASLGLGVALLLVNLAGIAAAVMPFLTLTLAYSFLAAAHFALPRPKPEDPS
jgi:uncharacterized membrane protein